jgi:hypothetical protein
VQRFDSAFLKCAGYPFSLDDQASRVEISILLERKLAIHFGNTLSQEAVSIVQAPFKSAACVEAD